nr:transposase [Vibrio sp. SCSIO 43153]
MRCKSGRQAKSLWKEWWAQVNESGITLSKELARKLRPYRHEISASAIYPLKHDQASVLNH